MICKNRPGCSKGGIAIYVINDLPFQIRDDLCLNVDREFESLFIEVKQNKRAIIVGEVYRVPNSSAKASVERFHTIANKLRDTKLDVIVGTDQNFDLLKYDHDKNTKDLLDGLVSLGFLPSVTKPTRITHSSATIIDNIYLKGFNYYTMSSGIIDCDMSDHLPVISFVGKTIKRKGMKPTFTENRKLTKTALDSINIEMQNKDWSCLQHNTLNDAYKNFTDHLMACIEQYAPLKTIRVSSKFVRREPWMTKGY